MKNLVFEIFWLKSITFFLYEGLRLKRVKRKGGAQGFHKKWKGGGHFYSGFFLQISIFIHNKCNFFSLGFLIKEIKSIYKK